mmetsp:Transcript_185/g.548  ORF Transcript_185/g.548 Transcript_185/m.548 type:complete len:143 (-) Transcript_185:60-488(-)
MRAAELALSVSSPFGETPLDDEGATLGSAGVSSGDTLALRLLLPDGSSGTAAAAGAAVAAAGGEEAEAQAQVDEGGVEDIDLSEPPPEPQQREPSTPEPLPRPPSQLAEGEGAGEIAGKGAEQIESPAPRRASARPRKRAAQ